MRGRKFLLFLVLGIFLTFLFSFASVPSTTAVSDITVKEIKNVISLTEAATFQLKIVNKAATSQRYSLYSLSQGWSIDPFPLKDRIIELRPGQEYITTIRVDPLENFPPGIYPSKLIIETDLGEKYTPDLKVYLLPDTPRDYAPTIKVEVDMDEKINPQEPVSAKLFVENRNPLDLSDMQLRVQSDIPEFDKTVQVALLPLDKKTVELSFTPNPYQQPKEYTLFFVFERKSEQTKELVKLVEQKIEIIPVILPFTVDEASEKIFLKKIIRLQVSNPGNVLTTQEVKYPLSFFSALLTKSEATIGAEEGQRFAVWEIALSPAETKTLSLVINYRWVFYLVLLLVLFGGFYLYARTPLSVRKTAVATRSAEDGTLSEIKVTLELKNNSGKMLKEVIVTDTVTSIANVEKSLELGTLKPQEISHAPHGTKVIWHIAEVEGHEHRLITYKVKAKLNILGTFSLPRATAEYKVKGKRRRKSYSNIYRLES